MAFEAERARTKEGHEASNLQLNKRKRFFYDFKRLNFLMQLYSKYLSALWNSANLPLQMEIAHQKEPQATFHQLGIAFQSQP